MSGLQVSRAELHALARKVQRALSAQGWQAIENGTAIASLDVETATGEKMALAYLKPNSDVSSGIGGILTGDYPSEGDNVLSTAWTPISLAATDDEIQALVQSWVEHAQQSIDQSYSRGLHLRQRGG